MNRTTVAIAAALASIFSCIATTRSAPSRSLSGPHSSSALAQSAALSVPLSAAAIAACTNSTPILKSNRVARMKARLRQLLDQRAAVAQRAGGVAAHQQLPHVAAALQHRHLGERQHLVGVVVLKRARVARPQRQIGARTEPAVVARVALRGAQKRIAFGRVAAALAAAHKELGLQQKHLALEARQNRLGVREVNALARRNVGNRLDSAADQFAVDFEARVGPAGVVEEGGAPKHQHSVGVVSIGGGGGTLAASGALSPMVKEKELRLRRA
jgi:hypothetical protein